jgi:hypothetical protein
MFVISTIGFLVRSNRKKSKRIKSLEEKVIDLSDECEQMNQILLKYGKKREAES